MFNSIELTSLIPGRRAHVERVDDARTRRFRWSMPQCLVKAYLERMVAKVRVAFAYPVGLLSDLKEFVEDSTCLFIAYIARTGFAGAKRSRF